MIDGASSTMTPLASRYGAQLPPSVSERSYSSTRWPALARRAPAAKPASPPPITTTGSVISSSHAAGDPWEERRGGRCRGSQPPSGCSRIALYLLSIARSARCDVRWLPPSSSDLAERKSVVAPFPPADRRREHREPAVLNTADTSV